MPHSDLNLSQHLSRLSVSSAVDVPLDSQPSRRSHVDAAARPHAAHTARERQPTASRLGARRVPPPDRLTSETRHKIALKCMIGRSRFNFRDSSDLARHTNPLRHDHMAMAIFWDALYTCHFNSRVDSSTMHMMPSDDELGAMLMECNMHPEIAEKFRHFAPRAKESLSLLFATLPGYASFAQVPPLVMAHAVVDPQKIDMLARHDIDTQNPLLMFLFDADAGFAHSVLTGRVAVAEALQNKTPFNIALVHQLQQAGGVGKACTDNQLMHYGAYFTEEGRTSLAETMERFVAWGGVQMAVRMNDQFIMALEPGRIHRADYDDRIDNIADAFQLAMSEKTLVGEGAGVLIAEFSRQIAVHRKHPARPSVIWI